MHFTCPALVRTTWSTLYRHFDAVSRASLEWSACMFNVSWMQNVILDRAVTFEVSECPGILVNWIFFLPELSAICDRKIHFIFWNIYHLK